MLKFEEARLYHYLIRDFSDTEASVSTSKGDMLWNKVKMRCSVLTKNPLRSIGYFCVENEDTLYLMKREPVYYA